MLTTAVCALTLAALAAGDASSLPASPDSWLSPEGRGADWAAATAPCRELLAGMDFDKPLVRRNRGKLEANVELLRRTESFDWRSGVAISFLRAMLEDLAAGVEPNCRYAGGGVAVPYWSATLERVETVWVHVPPKYRPGRSYQMFMYYKCGGGVHLKDGKVCGGYRPAADVANRTDTFHVWSSLSTQVKGRQGAVHELSEVVPALALQFGVDSDRVFLSGWSDGGFTALWLGSRYPDLVAGIAPVCANWQYTNVCDVGLLDLPMLAVDGWYDGGYNHGQFNRWHVLGNMGAPASGIWGHHGHVYQPYEDFDELSRILAWAASKRRDRWPKRVRYATWNLSWPGAYWISIRRMADPALAAQVDAEVKADNRVEVKTWNVARYRLDLSAKLLDAGKPVTVTTNGRPSYAGPFRRELQIEVVKLSEGKFVKSPAMPGGILAQVDRSFYGRSGDGGGLHVPGRKWITVRPTGGDEASRRALASWWPERAVADRDLTEDDLAGANLFVFGGPELNRFTARIAGQLPVKFGRGRFSIGSRVYDQPSHAVKFIHPNPLAPDRYVIVYAFNDAATFARNDFFGTRDETHGEFRKGDCVVMGIPTERKTWGVARRATEFESRHVLFDSNWQPPDETPVGTIQSPMDAFGLMRLRADAVREATGADVGWIAAATPGWATWRTTLPAGPVTLHDLATLDMLPEYVVVGEVTGETLLQLIDRSPFHTILTDRADPAYDAKTSLLRADVDPQKSYRIATGYYGRPAYGAEPKQLPPLLPFSSPEEFVASGHTSLPIRNVRQLPLEVTEAVARYVRKRGAVSPPAVCFDADAYILDPRANHFGACDWLHLGLRGDWQELDGGRSCPFRYVLSVGLRRSDDPALAPPRDKSKEFVELDLDGKARPAAFRFETLGKGLPVDATIDVEHLSIVAGKGGKAFALADAGASEAVGRMALLRLRLKNRSDQELTALAALSTEALMRVDPSVIRVPPERGERPDLVGILTDFRRPSRAAVLMRPTDAEDVQRLVLPGAGWNFGLYGLKTRLTLRPGAAVAVPLLLVAVEEAKDGAEPDLRTAEQSPLILLRPFLRDLANGDRK